MKKVFLGGTCNNTSWRDELISLLTIPYFNPVIEDDWSEEIQEIEEYEKEIECRIHLYVITSKMNSIFSIAEAVESAMSRGKLTYFHVIPFGFDFGQMKSLRAVCKLLEKYGAYTSINNDLNELVNNLNGQGK